MQLDANSSRIDVSVQLSKNHATDTWNNNCAMFLKLLEYINW